jgi:hypothetical protein
MLMLLGIQRPEIDEAHEVTLQGVIDDFTSTQATFVGQIEVEKHCPKEGYGSLTRCEAVDCTFVACYPCLVFFRELLRNHAYAARAS